MKYIIGIKIPQELAYKITLATRTLSKHFTPLDIEFIVLKHLQINNEVYQELEPIMTDIILKTVASSVKSFTVSLQCIDIINSNLAICADSKDTKLVDLFRLIERSVGTYADPTRPGFDPGVEVAKLSWSTSKSGFRVKRASRKLSSELPKDRKFEVTELHVFTLNEVTGKYDKSIPLPLGQ